MKIREIFIVGVTLTLFVVFADSISEYTENYKEVGQCDNLIANPNDEIIVAKEIIVANGIADDAFAQDKGLVACN